MRTLTDLKWLLTAGKPGPALKAGTILYLHGVGVYTSIRLKVCDAALCVTRYMVWVDGSRSVYITDELSNILRDSAAGKAGDDLLLGYLSIPMFHRDFRRMVRASGLVKIDLSDIRGMFRASAGSDYPLLKQYESAQPYSADDVRRAWLEVLPKLVVAI